MTSVIVIVLLIVNNNLAAAACVHPPHLFAVVTTNATNATTDVVKNRLVQNTPSWRSLLYFLLLTFKTQGIVDAIELDSFTMTRTADAGRRHQGDMWWW